MTLTAYILLCIITACIWGIIGLSLVIRLVRALIREQN